VQHPFFGLARATPHLPFRARTSADTDRRSHTACQIAIPGVRHDRVVGGVSASIRVVALEYHGPRVSALVNAPEQRPAGARFGPGTRSPTVLAVDAPICMPVDSPAGGEVWLSAPCPSVPRTHERLAGFFPDPATAGIRECRMALVYHERWVESSAD
jgi:hypothetical protein